MNRRYSIIFTFTAAAVLVSSIAYASKKKLPSKSGKIKQDISEVDLAANLLVTNAGYQQKSPGIKHVKKHDDAELTDLTMLDKSK